MKRTYFLIFFLLTFLLEISAQVKKVNSSKPVYTVIYGMVINPSKINIFEGSEKYKPTTLSENLTQYSQTSVREVFDYSRIAIRIIDSNEKPINLGIVKPISVKLEIGDDVIVYKLTNDDYRITDYYLFIKDLVEDEENNNPKYDFNNAEDVSVEIEFEESDDFDIYETKFKGKYLSRREFYKSFKSNTSGVWVPAALFSSNLKSDENGVPFASLPVGIAWGGKFYLKNGAYLGGSIMLNWLIHSEGKTSVDFTSQNDWSLSNLTVGTIIDINDALYLGYAYGFDLSTNGDHAGHMLVLGFGLSALNFLKTSKK